MNKIISITVVVLAIIIGGYFIFRGGDQSPQDSPRQLPAGGNGQMVMMNSVSLSFDPKEIRAKVGQPITVHVTSQGQHTFTIDELGVDVPTPNAKTTAVEFTPDKKGVFRFYCATPGHREAGQVGIITIE